MKKIFVFLLLLSINLFPKGKMSFEFDYARFKYDSTKTYLELYYSLGQCNLTPFNDNKIVSLGAYIDVEILNSTTNEVVLQKRYLSKTNIASKTDTTYKSKNLLGNIGYLMNDGKYRLNICATDFADSLNKVSYNESIQIKKYSSEKYSISDIQLATRIVSDSKNKESIFYKNTMEVFPNPINIYTENLPVLFFYSELYSLALPKYKDKELILIQQLNDSYGNALNIKRKVLPKHNNSVVEAGALNLKKYPTGSYTLLLNIFVDSMKVGISSTKRFYLINPSVKAAPNVAVENMDVKSSEFGILSEEECDEMFEVSTPIALQRDVDAYKKLENVDAKRRFLFDFWKVRDQIPETLRNEFKEEYMERVAFVEVRYKTFVKRGAKTDRGRIYLIYGEPDEVDNYPSEYNMKPHEIWYYHSIEGGVMFVFGDVTGYNNYELLHSTKRGEIRDETWARRITVD